MPEEEIEKGVESQQSQTRGKGGIKGFIIIGFIMTATYLIAGIHELRIGATFLGVWCIIITVLFFIGTILVMQNQYSVARILWLIGGIMGIPLGIVMIAQSNSTHNGMEEMITDWKDVEIGDFISVSIIHTPTGKVIFEADVEVV